MMKAFSRYLVLNSSEVPLIESDDEDNDITALDLDISAGWHRLDQDEDEKLVKVSVYEQTPIDILREGWQCPCGADISEYPGLKEGDVVFCTLCETWQELTPERPWEDIPEAVAQVLDVIITRLKAEQKTTEEIAKILRHFNMKNKDVPIEV